MDRPEKKNQINKTEINRYFFGPRECKKDAMQIWTKPRKLCCGGNAERMLLVFHYLKIKQV